jgi:hypothetical protein
MTPGFPRPPGQATPLRLSHSSPFTEIIRLADQNPDPLWIEFFCATLSGFSIQNTDTDSAPSIDNRAEIFEQVFLKNRLKNSFWMFLMRRTIIFEKLPRNFAGLQHSS